MLYRFNPFTGNLDLVDTNTAAGSDTQIQFNDGGVLAGVTGSTVDGSGNVTLTSVSTGLGTAGAPTYSFTGDPNTGIYSPGADQLAISTNGQGRLFIDVSGNVTVAKSVQALLSVADSGANQRLSLAWMDTPDGTGLGHRIAGDGINLHYFSRLGQNSQHIFYGNNAGSAIERLRITSDGKLGLGTSSPANKFTLSVASDTSLATLADGIRLDGVLGGVSRPLALTHTGSSYSYRGVGASRNNLYSNGTLAIQADSGDLEFCTGATLNAVITSLGNVGIGTQTPGDTLQINKNATSAAAGGLTLKTADSNESLLSIGVSTSLDAAFISSLQNGTGTARPLTFVVGSSSTNERMRITSDAYVRLASGTGGIQFNGDTAAANALDDYEEGTFTPTVIGSTTAGTATYSTQTGIYTKVGRKVTVVVYLNWSGGTGTGNLQVSGLPFTALGSAGYYYPVDFGLVDNIALTAANVITGYVSQNTTTVGIVQTPSGGGAYSVVPYDAAGHFMFSCTYFA